jgi:hypothetical protein
MIIMKKRILLLLLLLFLLSSILLISGYFSKLKKEESFQKEIEELPIVSISYNINLPLEELGIPRFMSVTITYDNDLQLLAKNLLNARIRWNESDDKDYIAEFTLIKQNTKEGMGVGHTIMCNPGYNCPPVSYRIIERMNNLNESIRQKIQQLATLDIE